MRIIIKYMKIETKERMQESAELCKQHLARKYSNKLALVNKFTWAIEGSDKSSDCCRWNQFTDVRGIIEETLNRVDAAFEKWLNP